MKRTHISDATKNEREQIIFHEDYNPKVYEMHGGIRKFTKLTFATALALLEDDYLNEDEYFNCSPTVKEFFDFVKDHNPKNWYFHGYTVSYERDDTRVTIEGIGSNKPLDCKDLLDFVRTFRNANELDAEDNDTVYCWYD